MLAFALTAIGMIASMLHLARPLRAPRSLAHIGGSWLSNEILAVIVFWVVLATWLLLALASDGFLPGLSTSIDDPSQVTIITKTGSDPVADSYPFVASLTTSIESPSTMLTFAALVACMLACVCGGVLIYAIARAYRVTGQPAWNGAETVLELIACALRVGVPAACALLIIQMARQINIAPLLNVCTLAVLSVFVAAILDMRASKKRITRLEGELSHSDGPSGRIPAALKCAHNWIIERYVGLGLGILQAPFVIIAGILTNLIGAHNAITASGFIGFAIVCAILAASFVVALISQGILRCAFYGYCDPSRVAPRFPQRRQKT